FNRTVKVGRVHVPTGDYVFRQGDKGNHFYLIEQGRAGIYVDGARRASEYLGPGDHFGEVAAGTQSVRNVSVKAETALDLVLMGSNDVRRLTDSLAALRKDVQRSLIAQNGYAQYLNLIEREPGFRTKCVSEWMSSPAETLRPD